MNILNFIVDIIKVIAAAFVAICLVPVICVFLTVFLSLMVVPFWIDILKSLGWW
mgnify:CR=1 FL=1